MSVSVLIVTWNNVETIEACLEAAAAAVSRVGGRVYVFDNASSDSTVDLVRQHPEVVLVPNLENIGFARGVNALAEMTTESYLALVNPDAEIAADSLVALVETARRRSDRAVVGGHLESATGTPQLAAARPFPTAFGLARWLILRRPHVWELPAYEKEVSAVSGAFLLVSRSLWSEVGGLDSGYPHAGEDLEICLAARHRGAAVVYQPKARCIHIGEASVLQAPAEIDVLRWIGSVRFARSYEGMWHAWFLRAFLALYSASVVATGAFGRGRTDRSRRRARLLWRWATTGVMPRLPSGPAEGRTG